MSKSRGQRGRSRGTMIERVRRRHGPALSARLEPGLAAQAVRSASTIPDVAGKFFNALKNSYAFFAGYAGDWTPAQAPRRRPRAAAGRPLAPEPARRHGRGGARRVGPVRRDRRGPRDHGLRGRRRLPVVRAGQPGPLLGARTARPTRRRSPRCTRRWPRSAGCWRPAAPFVSDWLHRALAGTSVHLARFPVPRGRRRPDARGGDGRGAPAGLAGRTARAGARSIRVRQPLARMQVAVPGGGARARRSTSCSSCCGSR